MNFLSMYNTPLEVLYLILSVGFALLVIFLLVTLFHIIGILSNVKKVSTKAHDTMDLINHYLWQPIKIMLMVIEKMKDVSHKSSKKK